MARGGEMQTVELDDVPEVAIAEVDDRPRRVRWRRPLVVVGVLALVGGALAGGQWVVDARERSAIAALEGIPGVIAPIGGDVEVIGTVSRAELGDQFGGSGEVTNGEDGSQVYHWYDGETGATLWSAPLLGPTPTLGYDEGSEQEIHIATYCQLGDHEDESDDTSPAGRVVCLVSDGGDKIGEDFMGTSLPVTTTRLVVLDTADGSVVADRSIDAARTLTLVPGLAVVAGLRDGAPVVTAYDLETGAEAWRDELPASTVASEDVAMGWSDAFVSSAGRRIVLQSPVNRLTVLSSVGKVLRDVDLPTDRSIDGWWVVGGTDRLIYSIADGGGGSTPMLVIDDDDPTKDRALVGTQVYVPIDDGSLPGLVLTGGGRLRAWDAATGTASWSSDDGLASSIDQAMILRGDVIVTSSNILAAFDGTTGEKLWTRTLAAGAVVTNMFTDGRNLFLEMDKGDGEDVPLVTAYDRTSGEEAFSMAYPAGIDQVFPGAHGRLIGHESAGDRYVELG
ncbi:PQQ-binding-like beta-propeller repeat protein [Cellulomonas sp. PhB150]|uniref:outer membrane protein assembly factor BamB family protein n=1 Tax=Cellulomonas sp. PhB150 TaxID=2485188 RepID=UPI000F47E799|nr:PQQ-binding-like beta-propeller repeat protein [Cellulomonas sp. PhB150]ROS27974.1 putative pyrroloquinoline-quinone binding quinoprotein [Cellulomonas sp. PhB150]